jgi:6-phosphogluconolactonase
MGFQGRTGVGIGARLAAVVALGVAAQLLMGCGAFFVCQGKSSCPTTTTSTASGDVAYVSNSATGSTYINGYVVTSGTLVAATGSPYSLGFVPTAMVVNPTNTLLFIASASPAAIYAYTIGTGGALTLANSGVAVAAELATAMDISPDGNYLFVLDASGTVMEQYKITSSTGVLTLSSTTTFSGTSVTPTALKVAPSGEFIALSLGQAGVYVFPYTESTGTVNGTGGSKIVPNSTAVSDTALAIDSNNYLYIGQTSQLLVYAVSTAGVPAASPVSSPAVASGPYSLAVSSTGAYVYDSLYSTSVVNGYTSASGVITPITGSPASPFSGPTSVAAIARDSTGGFVVAAGYNATSGVELYSVGTNGGLTATSSAATGTSTSIPTFIAMTH